MTTHRSLRTILSLTAIVALIALAGNAFALDEAQFRPQVAQFLADEALPEFEIRDGLRTQQINRWPDEGVLRVDLNADAGGRESWTHKAVITEDEGKIVGFVGAAPRFPVPMDVMPVEEALPIAEQFAMRHLPEIYADGGDVQVSVSDQITERGARTITFQRTVQSVQVPTLADVGVRVYDGKVGYWRRHHVPLAEDLQLPGTVDLDQAKQIAAENVPWEQHAPVFWFEEHRCVMATEDGQRCVWDLWTELKQPTTPEDRLEFLGHFVIDANSGEVLSFEGVNPKKAEGVSAREAYFAAGGEHTPGTWERPFPEVAFEDMQPRWSRDGQTIYFRSDRRRPGYPAWAPEIRGLFAIDADGGNLRCVIPRMPEMPKQSPSGDRIAWTADGIHIRGLQSGEERVIESPVRHNAFIDVAWLDGNTVAAILRPPIGAGSIIAYDLSVENPEPRTIADGEEFSSLMMDGADAGLYTGVYQGKWKIMRIDPAAEEAEPAVVAEGLYEGRGMRMMGDGRMLLFDARPMGVTASKYILDLATGETEDYRLPVIDNVRKWPAAPDIWEDGLLVFSANVRDFPDRERPSARVIFTANADGSDVRQVTPWEDVVVPMAE